jgi:hypothetical protein
MTAFSPVTDAELARARSDPAFRQKLLAQNLELLLSRMQRMRSATPSAGGGARQLREGVQLAVRLAELIQNAAARATRI